MTRGERSTVLRALEALRDGDPEEARSFLSSMLRETGPRRHSCSVCGLAFTFPGERDAHLANVHAAERAA